MMGRRKLVDFSSMSSSLSKSANFQWMQRRRESLDVYSTPRGEKRADVENTRETENRCNRCWKDGGDVRARRRGRGWNRRGGKRNGGK